MSLQEDIDNLFWLVILAIVIGVPWYVFSRPQTDYGIRDDEASAIEKISPLGSWIPRQIAVTKEWVAVRKNGRLIEFPIREIKSIKIADRRSSRTLKIHLGPFNTWKFNFEKDGIAFSLRDQIMNGTTGFTRYDWLADDRLERLAQDRAYLAAFNKIVSSITAEGPILHVGNSPYMIEEIKSELLRRDLKGPPGFCARIKGD